MFQDALSPDQENLDLANVNLMLELLVQKKKQLEAVRKGPGVISFFVCTTRFLHFTSAFWLLRFAYGWTISHVKKV